MTEPMAYTIQDAMRVASVSRTDLYRAMNSNALVARKRGRRIIILAEDLSRWLKSLPIIPSKGG